MVWRRILGRPARPEPRKEVVSTVGSSPSSPPLFGAAWAGETEDLRLAMGWNGGVSLAVWMGGVAVELDEARRAKSGGAPVTGAKTTGELYAAVSRAFQRELVIDILAGASAGGLNGAFLAGVIAHDKKLLPDFMRSRWLDIGDFGTLLQPLEEKQPASVMQGELFLRRLKDAFHDRHLEEAAMDLGANEWTTFRKVTLPLIAPAIFASLLLCFAVSVDDFVVTFFNAGPRVTFPLFVWGVAKVGAPPQVNVIGSVIFIVAVTAMVGNVLFQIRRARSAS